MIAELKKSAEQKMHKSIEAFKSDLSRWHRSVQMAVTWRATAVIRRRALAWSLTAPTALTALDLAMEPLDAMCGSDCGARCCFGGGASFEAHQWLQGVACRAPP